MDLAIIIVSYNTRDMLRACLNSLSAAAEGLRYAIFVVDNASVDGSAEMVRQEFPNVDLTINPANLGFARGNNLAIARANARYVLLLNPDTEPEPGSLTQLVRFMDAHPEAGACGPKLLNSDGTVQPNGAKFPCLLREFLGVTGLRRLAMPLYERKMGYGREDFDVLCEVDQVSGACLLVRSEVVRQVGPLDERFFMYYEEIEWCRRIKQAGWKVYYVPEARVVHHWMGSARQVSKQMTAQLFKSQLLYYQKTSGPLTVLGIRMVMAIGLAKNNFIHFGVAVKRTLRRAGILREARS
jgi:hypothetical protein